MTEHTDAEGRRIIQRSTGPSSAFFARVGVLVVFVAGIALGWHFRGDTPEKPPAKAAEGAAVMDAIRWTAGVMQAPSVETAPGCNYYIDLTEMTVAGGTRKADGQCAEAPKARILNAEVCQFNKEPGLQFWYRNMEGVNVYVTPCTPPRMLSVGHR